MSSLNADLWLDIFGRLERNDVLRCMLVCQSFSTHKSRLVPGLGGGSTFLHESLLA